MSTKSRLRIKPPRMRGRPRAGVLKVIRRAGRTLPHSGRHWRRRARAVVQMDVSPRNRFALHPLRERDTWSAFGLAAALHAVLAAILLSGLHWTSSPPASARAAVAERSAPPPLVSPAPRVANQPAATLVTGQAMPLAGGNQHPFVAPRHNTIPRRLSVRLEAQRTHTAAVTRVEPQPNEHADLERKTRLAALQAMAGISSPEDDRQQGNDGNTASFSYAEKVARRVRPNVVAPFDVQGNPAAVIAVTCAPNGALLSATLRRSSGNSQWDRAVLSAVEKSDPMPRDVGGTAPASFLITFQRRG